MTGKYVHWGGLQIGRLFVREHFQPLDCALIELQQFQSFSRQIMAFLLGRGLLGPCLSNIRLEMSRTSSCVDFNVVSNDS